jgi:hypothetical protein
MVFVEKPILNRIFLKTEHSLIPFFQFGKRSSGQTGSMNSLKKPSKEE